MLPRATSRRRGAAAASALCLCGSLLALVPASALAEREATDLSGVWEVEIRQLDYTWFHRFTLQVDGALLAGRAMWGSELEGEIEGGRLSFSVRIGEEPPFGEFSGTFEADRMTGICELEEIPSTWTARRPVSRPEDAPRVHDHVPTAFHRSLSAAAVPVLEVFPGDTIRTTTLDASGRDGTNTPRSLGGNPATGPFFVHGALPDDTLVVRITKLELNRDSAFSGASVVARAYSPTHFRQEEVLPWSTAAHWRLDPDRSVAILEDVSDLSSGKQPLKRLLGFRVPLHPMLGVIGVAPRQGAIDSRDSGVHGGNLDYNRIGEGTTLYLPVYHPGALLFVGDGHALQGDGELTGNALETSLDVELEVDVLQGRRLSNPRAEDEQFLMSIGVHGSLTEALQEATSDLARWLREDFGLDQTEVALVLGTSLRYDVADLVGNQVSVVARLRKEVLAQLGSSGGAAER